MVIQLPGDMLFDSGKDSLKPDGKKILKQVADVISGDATLSTRNFQVAGHTDKEPYAGQFFDNWGLSAHAGAQVVTFLVAPDTRRTEGHARPAAARARRTGPRRATARWIRSPEPSSSRRARKSRRTVASSSCCSRTSKRCSTSRISAN